MVISPNGVTGVTAVKLVVLVFRKETEHALTLHQKGKEKTALEIQLKQNLVTLP